MLPSLKLGYVLVKGYGLLKNKCSTVIPSRCSGGMDYGPLDIKFGRQLEVVHSERLEERL